jgi:hypothetical protein
MFFLLPYIDTANPTSLFQGQTIKGRIVKTTPPDNKTDGGWLMVVPETDT